MSILPEFHKDRGDEIWRKVKSAFRQSFEEWPCSRYEPSALRLDNDAHRSRATQTEPPCGLARGQLIEDHKCTGPMGKRCPNRGRLTIVQRRKGRPRRITSQYADLPTLDGRRDFRPTQAAESGEHLRSNCRRDKRPAVQLAEPGKPVEMREPDEGTRVNEGYLFVRHASRFLRSSRRVLALPRMTGMPSCETCCMKSTRGIPAIFAPRPSVTLSLL